MQNYYNNKNILIIGGSFGIGESLCYQLDNLGANLIIAARSENKIKDLCLKLSGNHIAVKCDLLERGDLQKLQKIAFKQWYKIDLIILAAGVYKPMNIDNFNLKEIQNILNINFNSFFDFIDIFLLDFRKKRIKHLAVISSVAGYFGMENSFAYGASKAGLSHFVESLYYELKKYQTKVQLINPAFVKTRLTDQNDFKMPLIISSHKAAEIILKKLPKKQFEIAFPKIFIFIIKFLQKLPYNLRFFILKKFPFK